MIVSTDPSIILIGSTIEAGMQNIPVFDFVAVKASIKYFGLITTGNSVKDVLFNRNIFALPCVSILALACFNTALTSNCLPLTSLGNTDS